MPEFQRQKLPHNKAFNVDVMVEREITPKTSITVATYPILAVLVAAESIPNLGRGRTWLPINSYQESFLSQYFDSRGDIPSIPEIESRASRNASELNKFLRARGFDVQLERLERDEFAAASVLDLQVKWLQGGTATKLFTGNRENYYEAVSIDKFGADIYSSTEHDEPIVKLRTKTGDTVFITPHDDCPKNRLFLPQIAQTIQNDLESHHKPLVEYEGVIFPMVDLNQKIDIRWMKGMYTTGDDGKLAIVSQALQQNILRINEIGAIAKSGVALGMTRSMSVDKMPFIVNGPFLIWFSRQGIKDPLFVGHIEKDAWKNPGNIFKQLPK